MPASPPGVTEYLLCASLCARSHGAPTLCQPLRPESRSAYSVPASAPGVTERLLCASLCARSHGAPTLCQPLHPESWSAYSVPASAPGGPHSLSFSSHPHMETRLCVHHRLSPTRPSPSSVSLSWAPRKATFPSPLCSGRGIGWSYGLERASGHDLSGFRVEAVKKPWAASSLPSPSSLLSPSSLHSPCRGDLRGHMSIWDQTVTINWYWVQFSSVQSVSHV